MCIIILRHIAEQIRCARERIGIGAPARVIHDHIFARIVLPRRDLPDAAAGNASHRCKALIVHACDVCAARADVHNFFVMDADHTAARHAERSDIQTLKISLVSANLRVLDHDLAVFDDADVDAGAACLKEDPVGHLFIHQCAGYTGGKSRQHGQNRALSHLLNAHYAAVAAHDHQIRLNFCVANRRLCHICRLHHFGNQAGVHNRCACAHFQAIKLADFMSAGRIKPLVFGKLCHAKLIFRVVYTECLAGNDHLSALRAKSIDYVSDALVCKRFAVEKSVHAFQIFSGSKFDVSDICLAACAARIYAGRHADDPHARNIAFQQRIRRLRRAMGNEGDILRCDPVFLH